MSLLRTYAEYETAPPSIFVTTIASGTLTTSIQSVSGLVGTKYSGETPRSEYVIPVRNTSDVGTEYLYREDGVFT